MGELAPEAVAFLAAAAPPRPWPSLTPTEAREQNLAARRADAGAPDVPTLDRRIRRPDGSSLDVRIYSPFDDGPVLVFFHGGGWVYGDLDMADGFCRRLAHGAGVTVCSVDYRLAPEHPFPLPLDDAVLAVQWASEHLAAGAVVGVIGSSAGGNLAAAASLVEAGSASPRIGLQVLLCPVTDRAFDSPSYLEHGVGKFLEAADMVWYWDQYHPAADGVSPDPMAAVLRADAALLAAAPPALVITAEHDVLRDEGEAYAARLRSAGVVVEQHRHDGMIHAFAVLSAFAGAQARVIEQTSAAVDRQLRAALS